MTDLLRRYIMEILREVREQPRVGDQLKNADGSPESGEDDSEEESGKEAESEVDEMSGAGAVAGAPGHAIVGPQLPFGARTPGKKKKPGWR